MSRETKTYTGTRTQWTIERNAALEKQEIRYSSFGHSTARSNSRTGELRQNIFSVRVRQKNDRHRSDAPLRKSYNSWIGARLNGTRIQEG